MISPSMQRTVSVAAGAAEGGGGAAVAAAVELADGGAVDADGDGADAGVDGCAAGWTGGWAQATARKGPDRTRASSETERRRKVEVDTGFIMTPSGRGCED
jgi:hypothetical protein